ncbi:twin-arginine translocation signal domain-containing protein [Actinosynnema sp. NPDC002837]
MALSRRHLLKGAAVAGGTLALARTGTALGGDFGSASWQTAMRGVPVNGLAFRLGTGGDDLRGPEGLEPASAITASVVISSFAGRTTITGQLNGGDEGWAPWTVHDKWLSFARAGAKPVLAENVQSVHLHWTPNHVWSPDNWDMADISIFHPRGDDVGDPAFTGTIPVSRFALMFSGSGRPWHHRFKENIDSEGGPDYSTTNPGWNPVGPQRNWRWCNRCQGLFFGGNNTTGACPAGGGHNSGGSANYFMTNYVEPRPINVQSNWRWCNRCQGLFFGGWAGRCPLGGGHNWAGSSDYTVFVNDGVNVSKQAGWRSCSKCGGLYFAGNPTAGVCPAGGGHDPGASWQYVMAFTALA